MTTISPPRRRSTAPQPESTRPVYFRALHSVRLRILLGYTALLLVSLVAATVITRHSLLNELDEEIRTWQEHQAFEFQTDAAAINRDTGAPFADSVEALFDEFLGNHVTSEYQAFYAFVGGAFYKSSADAPTAVTRDPDVAALWTAGQSPITGQVESTDGAVSYLTVPVIDSSSRHAGTFVVATYPGHNRDHIRSIMRVLVLVGSVLIAIAVLLGLSLARHVLRPVRRLTDTALQIEESDLSARIPVTGDDELSELGRTFNNMLDRLEDSFTTQRSFLDDVAHELRTPITIVRGHLELMGDDPSEREQTIALVTDELDRMARSVDELLVVAKASRPDFLQLALVDVHDLLESVFIRARALGPRDWQIGTCPRRAQAIIVADEDRLSQALLALASNAVDHSAPNSPIVFEAEVSSARVVLSVTDHGTGVDPAVRDRLFTRYSRAASSEAGHPGGAGLGLPIVASIADAHGGRVEVRSTLGEGSTFSLVLPRRDPMEDADR